MAGTESQIDSALTRGISDRIACNSKNRFGVIRVGSKFSNVGTSLKAERRLSSRWANTGYFG